MKNRHCMCNTHLIAQHCIIIKRIGGSKFVVSQGGQNLSIFASFFSFARKLVWWPQHFSFPNKRKSLFLYILWFLKCSGQYFVYLSWYYCLEKYQFCIKMVNFDKNILFLRIVTTGLIWLNSWSRHVNSKYCINHWKTWVTCV